MVHIFLLWCANKLRSQNMLGVRLDILCLVSLYNKAPVSSCDFYSRIFPGREYDCQIKPGNNGKTRENNGPHISPSPTQLFYESDQLVHDAFCHPLSTYDGSSKLHSRRHGSQDSSRHGSLCANASLFEYLTTYRNMYTVPSLLCIGASWPQSLILQLCFTSTVVIIWLHSANKTVLGEKAVNDNVKSQWIGDITKTKWNKTKMCEYDIEFIVADILIKCRLLQWYAIKFLDCRRWNQWLHITWRFQLVSFQCRGTGTMFRPLHRVSFIPLFLEFVT